MTEALVRCHKLGKDYGEGRGVFDLNLEVGSGEILGFLGPNGAGKTTTMRIMLDLIRPTTGWLEIMGMNPQRQGARLRQEIGYLPGDLNLPAAATGKQLLGDLASLRGFARDEPLGLANHLDVPLDRPIRRLSKGNRQKLGIVQAFFHRPPLLILDEPTDGLDPIMRRAVHALIRQAARRGQTVFLSSHVIHEVEQVCDRVAILRGGHLKHVDSIGNLRRQRRPRVLVRFAHAVDPRWFSSVRGVEQIDYADNVVRFTMGGVADHLIKALGQHEVLAVKTDEQDLEDQFVAMYGGA